MSTIPRFEVWDIDQRRTYPYWFKHRAGMLNWDADVFAWCEEEFDGPHVPGESRWMPTDFGFAFRDETAAMAFKMVWC